MSKVKKKFTKKVSKTGRKLPGRGGPGKHTENHMEEHWVELLKANEQVSKGNRKTDSQILGEMRRNWPDRKTFQSGNESYVKVVRAAYNRGKWTDGKAPAKPSHEYDNNGEAVQGRGSRSKGKANPSSKKKTGRKVSGKKTPSKSAAAAA